MSAILTARAGVLADRSGREAVVWPHELLRALDATLKAECGPVAETILRNAGKVWGRSLAERLGPDTATPLVERPAARVAADISAAFARLGWGRIGFDFTRHEQGLVVIAVTNGPSTAWAERGRPAADHLLAGTFAGLFSALAGAELDCLQTDYEVAGTAPAQFIVSLPSRLNRAVDAARQGQPHDRVLSLLETIVD